MKNVVICQPRLDIPFKKEVISGNVSEILKYRYKVTNKTKSYWGDFSQERFKYHKNLNDNVKILEAPMWQITIDLLRKVIKTFNFDLVYIPHHSKFTFDKFNELETDPLLQNIKIKYYMQMSLPWLFQVDEEGWCAGASNWPILPNGNDSKEILLKLKERQNLGKSKFQQPDLLNKFNSHHCFRKDFVLFACQIPHDQTIKHHSKISVIEALKRTIIWCKKNKLNLIIKSHPENLVSMEPLYEIFKKYNYGVWVNNMNINFLLKKCITLFCVNSGVGMEAIIHEKPVFCFGDADYASVSHKITTYNTIDEAWKIKDRFIQKYPSFINSYYKNMVQVRELSEINEI